MRLRGAGDTVRHTGHAEARDGGVAITGQVGTVNLHPPSAPRSGYLQRVAQIAPENLRERDGERAQLAAFCTAEDPAPSYLWWRAPAWAGKSALMASFVLDPPAGVRVVSFFVTARWAGQNDRVAFAEVLIEQLSELLDEALPPLLTEATREAHLLDMLTRAAHACHDRGERLILVVDGLDEDRGVTAGADAHSIAALLPARPAAGARVVVAGRPNPPVPADVPDGHPLRDPATMRWLGVSEHAGVVRQDAERELKRLLTGSDAERELLGLVAAAGGGLSGRDLAELTGWNSYDVSDQLDAVSARTFDSRAGRLEPATTVYVLGHEELQQQAMARLGPERLEQYRQKIHTWAYGYRHRGWPGTTPEYLLRGYPGMLHAAGDLPRMVALATDRARHDRMLAALDGDAAALAEVDTVWRVLHGGPAVPALADAVRLAIHREMLRARNTNVPAGLPAVWAALGRPGRAEALAKSIADPARRALALASIARPEEASEAAETIACAVERATTLVAIRGASRSYPWHVLSENEARTIARPTWRARALASHRPPLADEAEAVARALTHPVRRAEALCGVAAALAEVDPARAARIAEEAELAAREMVGEGHQAHDLNVEAEPSLIDLADAAVAGGDNDLARDYLGQALDGAGMLSDYEHGNFLIRVAPILAVVNGLDQGVKMARSLDSDWDRRQALLGIAEAVRTSAALDTAIDCLTEYPVGEHEVRRRAAVLAGAIGAVDCAERLIALAEAGHTDDDEQSVRDRDDDRADLAYALAAAGRIPEAVTVATTVVDPATAAQTLAAVAGLAPPAGRQPIIARGLATGAWAPMMPALTAADPAAARAAADQCAGWQRHAPPVEPGPSGCRILVIEMDADLCLGLELALTRLSGHSVVTSTDGAEGIGIAAATHPDLVIVQTCLAGMDGWQVTTRLREITDAPIVIASCTGGPDALRRSVEAGADAHLHLPFTNTDLVAMVEGRLHAMPGPARWL